MVNGSMLNTNSWRCKLVIVGLCWVGPSYLTPPYLTPLCDQVTRLTPGYNPCFAQRCNLTGTLSNCGPTGLLCGLLTPQKNPFRHVKSSWTVHDLPRIKRLSLCRVVKPQWLPLPNIFKPVHAAFEPCCAFICSRLLPMLEFRHVHRSCLCLYLISLIKLFVAPYNKTYTQHQFTVLIFCRFWQGNLQQHCWLLWS